MKKLMIPLVIAVVAGLGGGSAFSFVNAKHATKAAAAYSADSLQKHVQDSTVVADSVEKDVKAKEEAARAEEALMTPADSIRAAQNQPTTLKFATKELENAIELKKSTTAGVTSGAPGVVIVPPAKPTPSHTSDAVRTAGTGSNTNSSTTEKGLPDSRIAKIFSAMQSKDAAKVLEQMSDNDIRVILGLMSDKQAAAILVALSPTRAAMISKGVILKKDVPGDSTNHDRKSDGESS